mgnify:CR=1 FL=1
MKTSRIAAIKANERFYQTGKPCKWGHDSKRLTVDGSCIACRLEYQSLDRERIRCHLRGEPWMNEQAPHGR